MTDPGTVDAQVLRSVAAALSARRLAELLVVLEGRIGWLVAADAAAQVDPAARLAELHRSCGSAASVGFTALGRLLAAIERRRAPGAVHLDPPPRSDAAGGDACGTGSPLLSAEQAAIRMAWQASLAAAAACVPELRRHRPFGSSK